MMHYLGTFSRFLFVALSSFSLFRRIEIFLPEPSSWAWPTSRTVLRPFIFGVATAWILITFEKVVHVSRARKPASDRKRGILWRLVWSKCNGEFLRPVTVRWLSTKFPEREKEEKKIDKLSRVLCFFFFPTR